MSATIYWQPARNRSGTVNTDSTSSLIAALDEAFGRRWPMELDTEDAPVIHGMVAAGLDGARDLRDAIEKHGAIVLRVES